MAAFDAVERKIVVRVVFDGPGFAGKTTNIRQLHSFFTAQRRGVLITPEEIGGRTQLFDWMHLDGGLVQGYALRCQMLSVPGQQALSKRRWNLLRTADVVVFVCDSTSGGLEEAKPMFALLHEYLAHRFDGEGIPLVVQANKQDLPGTANDDAVREAFGLPGHVPVVAATAERGAGVRETAVLAIRTAANRVQRLLLEKGIEALVGDPGTADELMAELRRVEPDAPSSEVQWGGEQGVAEGASEPSEDPDSADEGAPRLAEWPLLPPLPDPGVPSGFIWPAATGRDVLRRVRAAQEPLVRVAPVGEDRHALVLEGGMWRLTTARRSRYRDVDEGRAALLQQARRMTALGSLLPPRTVLSLEPGEEGVYWLWKVTPGMAPLSTRLAHDRQEADMEGLCSGLRSLARAQVSAMTLAVRRRLVLSLQPRCFAQVGDDVFYTGDQLEPGSSIPELGAALLDRVGENAPHRDAVETYLVALIEAMGEVLSAEDIQELGVIPALESHGGDDGMVAWARERLVAYLRGLRPLALARSS